MRYPRNAKIFRGQLDAAPFLGVFFILALFLFLSSRLVYMPGVSVDLPKASSPLSGITDLHVVLSIDRDGHAYFEHQLIQDDDALVRKLTAVTTESKEPLTLLIQADRETKQEVSFRIMNLAASVGFKEVFFAAGPDTPKPKIEAHGKP